MDDEELRAAVRSRLPSRLASYDFDQVLAMVRHDLGERSVGTFDLVSALMAEGWDVQMTIHSRPESQR